MSTGMAGDIPLSSVGALARPWSTWPPVLPDRSRAEDMAQEAFLPCLRDLKVARRGVFDDICVLRISIVRLRRIPEGHPRDEVSRLNAVHQAKDEDRDCRPARFPLCRESTEVLVLLFS
jgi:hypothetical protein